MDILKNQRQQGENDRERENDGSDRVEDDSR